MTATKMGKLKCNIQQENGRELTVTLDKVKYVPELWINLFSIGKALQNGFNIRNDGQIIKLTKDSVTLQFKEVAKTKNGFVPGIRLKQIVNDLGITVVKSKGLKFAEIRTVH